ncbi:hypothetical protein ZWY2020_032914 [Hordeum vulgare]|nr:hypothetical protein ZWY2020_032914 [Hordeum vulgare]
MSCSKLLGLGGGGQYCYYNVAAAPPSDAVSAVIKDDEKARLWLLQQHHYGLGATAGADCDSMEAVQRRLKELGIRYVQRRVAEGGIHVDQIFFHDPDGFMTEVCTCDNLPVIPLVTQLDAAPARRRSSRPAARGSPTSTSSSATTFWWPCSTSRQRRRNSPSAAAASSRSSNRRPAYVFDPDLRKDDPTLELELELLEHLKIACACLDDRPSRLPTMLKMHAGNPTYPELCKSEKVGIGGTQAGGRREAEVNSKRSANGQSRG